MKVFTTAADPINFYSTIRSSERQEDMRAGTITTEGDNYKVIVDMRDIDQGSIVVKALNDSEIYVEGKMEKKEETQNGTRYATKQNVRRFVMPNQIKSELVTSALSSDGVLTVTAPKKESHF